MSKQALEFAYFLYGNIPPLFPLTFIFRLFQEKNPVIISTRIHLEICEAAECQFAQSTFSDIQFPKSSPPLQQAKALRIEYAEPPAMLVRALSIWTGVLSVVIY